VPDSAKAASIKEYSVNYVTFKILNEKGPETNGIDARLPTPAGGQTPCNHDAVLQEVPLRTTYPGNLNRNGIVSLEIM
jgi:hypothetical protein